MGQQVANPLNRKCFMNSYKFVLQYDNNADARSASKTLSAHMLNNGAPTAAATVRYNGKTVEFVIEGNVSALSWSHELTEFGAVYTVTPVGESEPLLVAKAMSPTHILYMKA